MTVNQDGFLARQKDQKNKVLEGKLDGIFKRDGNIYMRLRNGLIFREYREFHVRNLPESLRPKRDIDIGHRIIISYRESVGAYQARELFHKQKDRGYSLT